MKKICEFMKILGESLVISALVCFIVAPVSCKITPEGVDIIGGDYMPPVLEDIKVQDSETIELQFSEKITIKNSVLSVYMEGISNSNEHSSTEQLSPALAAAGGAYGSIDTNIIYKNDDKTVVFELSEPTVTGKKYELYGVVEDRIGNTLTFCVPFTGYNSKVAKLLMTEIRSCTSTGKTGGLEFVEFLVVEDGNTAGLKLKFGTSTKTDYSFPAMDVKRGDLIVVHTEKGLSDFEDESLDDITVCNHKDASPLAIDLWADNSKGIIGNTDEVIVLYDQVQDCIMDAVMYKKNTSTSWSTSKKTLADSLNEAGIYDSGDIENATDTNGSNAEGTISEKNTINRVDAWKIYQSVQNGVEIEMPVQADSSTWKVLKNKASPGKIEAPAE